MPSVGFKPTISQSLSGGVYTEVNPLPQPLSTDKNVGQATHINILYPKYIIQIKLVKCTIVQYLEILYFIY